MTAMWSPSRGRALVQVAHMLGDRRIARDRHAITNDERTSRSTETAMPAAPRRSSAIRILTSSA